MTMWVRLGILLVFLPALGWTACQTLPLPSTVLTQIHVNQIGYTPGAQKVAVLADPQTGFNSAESYTPPTTLEVRVAGTGAIVFTGARTVWNAGATDAQSGDKVWWFDFSALTTPGQYYIFDTTANARSDVFEISPTVYREVLKHAVRMFYYQRSGFAKAAPYTNLKWADGPAFLAANQDPAVRLVTDQGNAATERDLRGGWFDAGDYNKYTLFAHYALLHLLHAYQQHPSVFTDDYGLPESGNGLPDILDEVKWELDFLLRMQQANGSVLVKVSTTTAAWATPPSADTHVRYYAAASTASTACTAAVFALASAIYTGAGQSAYGTALSTAATNAWTWAFANQNVASSNAGFTTADPEAPGGANLPATYYRQACLREAAAYLYALNQGPAYKTYFEANYTSAYAIAADYQWIAYHPWVQENMALLHYTVQPGITPAVKTAIEAKKLTTMGNYMFFPALASQRDAYRANLESGEYVWGSNEVKSAIGNMFLDMIRYNQDSANHTAYRHGAAGYLHYLLGVNPMGITYLTNLYAYGAERSANEIWHGWFFYGSDWQNALTSPKGPAPGYLAGGPNEYYGGGPDCNLSPPGGEPRQKAYLDSNENWRNPNGDCALYSINEPSIVYQGAFVHLLAGLVAAP
jgi:hypothetical protein